MENSQNRIVVVDAEMDNCTFAADEFVVDDNSGTLRVTAGDKVVAVFAKGCWHNVHRPEAALTDMAKS
jgi:plastocyanin